MVGRQFVASLLVAGAVAGAALAIASTTKPAASRAGAKPAAASASVIDRGRNVAMVAGCNDCHTPGTMFGAPDFGRQLSGSELGWSGPWGTTYARNLTPDLETGLGYYSEKEIIAALRSGKRLDGKPMLPPMPWQNLTAMSDADMHALITFLKSLPPVSHKVPEVLAPGQVPTSGAWLSFPAPPAWDAPRDTSR
jgi:mono/diheme cytochrome c family protein